MVHTCTCSSLIWYPLLSPYHTVCKGLSNNKSFFLQKVAWVLRLTKRGVVNGKLETLRDSEASIFLCEPETFDYINCKTENWDSKKALRKKSRLQDVQNLLKNETYFLKDPSPPLQIIIIIRHNYMYIMCWFVAVMKWLTQPVPWWEQKVWNHGRVTTLQQVMIRWVKWRLKYICCSLFSSQRPRSFLVSTKCCVLWPVSIFLKSDWLVKQRQRKWVLCVSSKNWVWPEVAIPSAWPKGSWLPGIRMAASITL